MERLTAHYHEIALKGRNRARFERALVRNLYRSTSDLAPTEIRPLLGRLLIETEDAAEKVAARVAAVCGVAYVLFVEELPRDLDAVGEAVRAWIEDRGPAHFRITTRRADKSFPLTSVEINRRVGAIVHEATGIPVRLKGAEAEALLVVLPDRILFGRDKRAGAGGLPVGTGGKVAVLLSGGFDSPVAAWRLIRRGCTAHFVHFHSHPLVDRTTQEKVHDLAEVLTRSQYRSKLSLVPLARIQTEVRLKTPERFRVLLYRRFMVRLAEKIAAQRGCSALVTGDSLGQVASQTLENIRAVSAVATLPVLRPLIGDDKQDIVNEAAAIGTHDISIRKDQDCCSLFVPPRPATKASAKLLERAERDLDVEALVADALERTEMEAFEWPAA